MTKKKKKFSLHKNFSYIIGGILIFLILAVTLSYILKPKSIERVEGESEYDFIIKNLVSGGPPKDGIPSIDDPIYFPADQAQLDDDEIVFGVNYKGFIAAYPNRIMYWHEIVNEEVQGEKIAITLCPLTGSVIGYKGHELGVSGELYNSNLVMYDRETDARIPQILGEGIEGELEGVELEEFPVEVTTWEKWRSKYPNSVLLSEVTGNKRDYRRNPYPGYDSSLRVWYPLANEDERLKTKDLVLGINHNKEEIAVLVEDFQKRYPEGLEIEVGGEKLFLTYNTELELIDVDKDVSNFEVFWFAWAAYYPETELII